MYTFLEIYRAKITVPIYRTISEVLKPIHSRRRRKRNADGTQTERKRNADGKQTERRRVARGAKGIGLKDRLHAYNDTVVAIIYLIYL